MLQQTAWKKRKTARLTGTPTRRQIVRDVSLFSKLYSRDSDTDWW